MEPSRTQFSSVDVARRFVERARSACRLEEAYLFGSQARGDTHEDSDFDIIVVSQDFDGQPWHERGIDLLRFWDYDHNPGIDLITYTPDEFAQKCREIGTISDAMTYAIRLA